MGATRRRTAAEWITFAVSALLLAAVVGLLLLQLAREHDPADPFATVETRAIEHVGSRYRVPVEVRNAGDRPAADVEVSAELATGGELETAAQTIDFLGADETVRLVFLFVEDPAAGDLTVTVTGFRDP